jgi:hypothetical protein
VGGALVDRKEEKEQSTVLFRVNSMGFEIQGPIFGGNGFELSTLHLLGRDSTT